MFQQTDNIDPVTRDARIIAIFKFKSNLFKQSSLFGEQNKYIGCLLVISQRRLDAVNEAVEVDDPRPGPGAVPQLIVVVVELVPGEHEVFPLPVVSVDHPLGGEAPQIATGSGTGDLSDCRNILKQRSQS